MPKKYIVRLSEEERNHLQAVVKKFKGSSQKVRRAQILLKADADGPNWTDERLRVNKVWDKKLSLAISKDAPSIQLVGQPCS